MPGQGDEFYLGLLDELPELHIAKSGGYGTEDDPLANFVAVAEHSGDPLWRYPRLRVVEKLARIDSLERQGRYDELEQEHVDGASLLLCAEALRRRVKFGRSAPMDPSRAASPQPAGGENREPHPAPPATSLHDAGPPPREATGETDAASPVANPFSERLLELAVVVAAVGLRGVRPALSHEIAEALLTCSDLIGPERSEGPHLAPSTQARSADAFSAHAPHTPCKSPVFRSDPAAEEASESRTEGAAGQDTSGVGRHEPSPASAPARLRDAQRGDDGWVRAPRAIPWDWPL